MREYRISKYDPQYRVNGIFAIHEWTSISDIGKIFDAGILSYEQYEKMEQIYIDCCIALIRCAGIKELSVSNPEYYDTDVHFAKSLSDEINYRQIIMCCLREKCWAKLEAKDFFIHFGYDYYIYVGTELPYFLVEEISRKHGLFCEQFLSPYKSQD